MLREMPWYTWECWKRYMHLAPFGEERMDFRFACLEAEIWNVQIAKSQGAYDSSPRKRGRRPEFREVKSFMRRIGDMPELPKRQMTSKQQFEVLRDIAESWGGTPVKR